MPSKRATKSKQAAAPGPAEIPAPFHEAYGSLLQGLPDSVVGKVKARAEVRRLDLSADDDAVRDLLESARASYERKKAGSRASAAKRRAAAKAAPAAAPADAPAVEPPEEPLP